MPLKLYAKNIWILIAPVWYTVLHPDSGTLFQTDAVTGSTSLIYGSTIVIYGSTIGMEIVMASV